MSCMSTELHMHARLACSAQRMHELGGALDSMHDVDEAMASLPDGLEELPALVPDDVHELPAPAPDDLDELPDGLNELPDDLSELPDHWLEDELAAVMAASSDNIIRGTRTGGDRMDAALREKRIRELCGCYVTVPTMFNDDEALSINHDAIGKHVLMHTHGTREQDFYT